MAQVEVSVPRVSEVHVTVIALGQLDVVDLRRETELVKAALLYADRVTLASPKALLLAKLTAFGAADRRARLDAMAELMSETVEGGAEAARSYRQLRRQARLSLDERRKLAGIERILEQGRQGINEAVEGMLTAAGAGELALAMEQGSVELHGLGADDYLDTVVESVVTLLADTVAGGTRTFPLFDDGAGDLMRSVLEAGNISDSRSRRATEVGIAGQLLAGLEAFPSAEMDVVLDVRRQLQGPLAGFRAALAEASGHFATEAWDAEFAREVEDLHRCLIAPAIEELRVTLDDLGARGTLLRVASTKEGAVGIATLGLTACGALGFSDLPAVLYGASVPAVAATGATEALERRRIRRQAAAESFYFLYQAGQQLGR